MHKRSPRHPCDIQHAKRVRKGKGKKTHAQTYQRLFEKLCKNHLTGKVRERQKKQWKEQRQGTLISVESKADKGNRLTRFESINGQLYLRITTWT
jgi:hypothetical protein